MPNIHLLHSFYSRYRDELAPYFIDYVTWESVIRKVLGCPVEFYLGQKKLIRYQPYGYGAINSCFQKDERKRRKGHSWKDRFSKKSRWCKEFEPCSDELAYRKEMREHKRLWREMLGKEKEVRKGVGSHYYCNGPRRYYKTMRDRHHRRWVKRNLRQEQYDVFHRKEREMFFDWKVWGY